MDFRLTAEQQTFRDEVRSFLDETMTPEFREHVRTTTPGYSAEFSRKLSERHWIGLNWPAEDGGGGRSTMERFIFNEELMAQEAPIDYHIAGERQVAPSLIRHGNDAQRKDYVPPIIRSELSFCLGLSESNAGSDLANVQTTAVRDGDEYVVNGSKIWTSYAWGADFCWLIVRTDPEAPKHRGISILIVDMKSPGVQVQPLTNITGFTGFCEIFFDDVRVPATNRVGEENTGWYILAEHLDFERAGIDRIAYNKRLYDECLTFIRRTGRLGDFRDRIIRSKIADLYVELEVGRLLAYRVAWMMDAGVVPNSEVSMSKAFGSEWTLRMTNAVYQAFQYYGIDPREQLPHLATIGYLASASDTIRAGTSEIQRNIIAQRGLGLPR